MGLPGTAFPPCRARLHGGSGQVAGHSGLRFWMPVCGVRGSCANSRGKTPALAREPTTTGSKKLKLKGSDIPQKSCSLSQVLPKHGMGKWGPSW